MGADPIIVSISTWQTELPDLVGHLVTLREPAEGDRDAIVDLLLSAGATRFGLDSSPSNATVDRFIERLRRDRSAGASFTYAVTAAATRQFVGLLQVRQLDPAFEAAEWECIIAPSSRGMGVFVEAAHLVASFSFGSVGTRRLEARVLLQDGRGNGALRKIGAVQEGILRRSVRRGSEYLDRVLWTVLIDDWNERQLPGGRRAD